MILAYLVFMMSEDIWGRMETTSTSGYGAQMVIEFWRGLARESRGDCRSNSVAIGLLE